MNVFELEDALVEFIEQNTSELKRFHYSERQPLRDNVIVPNVFAGFVPRNQVGEIDPTGIKRYPAIIINARKGGPPTNGDSPWECEFVYVSVIVGTFDDNKEQQGYRDCQLLVQRINDRVREQSIIRQRFQIQMPLIWEINRTYTSGQNAFPYWFGDLTLIFRMPVMTSQFAPNAYTGDTLGGMYDERATPDTRERPTPLYRRERDVYPRN
jgi:hypothetical protein